MVAPQPVLEARARAFLAWAIRNGSTSPARVMLILVRLVETAVSTDGDRWIGRQASKMLEGPDMTQQPKSASRLARLRSRHAEARHPQIDKQERAVNAP